MGGNLDYLYLCTWARDDATRGSEGRRPWAQGFMDK